MNYLVLQSLEAVLMISIAYAWGRTEIIQPKVQPVYVKSGDTLELICEHDDPFSLQWFRAPLLVSPRHYTKIDTSSESGFYMTSQVKDGRGWTNLTKSNVSVNDAGSYRCSLVSKPDRAYAVDVIVLIASEVSGVVTRFGASAAIGCTVSNTQRIRVGLSWAKDGKPITRNEHYNITEIETDSEASSSINITKVGDKDIGAYDCIISLKNGINLTQVVNLMSHPQAKTSRSRNLVAGASLELDCRVSGWPIPRVTWQRYIPLNNSRIPLNLEDGRLSLKPGVAAAPHGIPVENATLVITNVTYSDRDVYICDVASYVDGNWRFHNGTVLVRIKGKYAALWPLLGILLEAVILFVIIIVHERNRARKKAENVEGRDNSSNHLENSTNAQRGGSASHETMRLRKN